MLSKFAKQTGSCCTQGTFAPLWQVLKASAEKLSVLHMQMVQKVSELVKEINKYSEELHKKHKTVSIDHTHSSRYGFNRIQPETFPKCIFI